MPWEYGTLAAACDGLRQAASRGDFLPNRWNLAIYDNQGSNFAIFGCAWGQIGWYVALHLGGEEYARQMLPPGITQRDVNRVLKVAGLTRDEIKSMEPGLAWRYFDQELQEFKNLDENNFVEFTSRSEDLAEYFIAILKQVPEKQQKTVSTSSTLSSWEQLMALLQPKLVPAKAELELA